MTGGHFYGIFIDTNDTIYITDYANNRIQAWYNGSSSPTSVVFGNFSTMSLIFVTATGDIYFGNYVSTYRIDKWQWNSNSSIPVMYTGQPCHGLFIDMNNTAYCSIKELHRIVTKSLNSNQDMLTIVAGTDCAGSTPNKLNKPHGIFVDINFNLYVADLSNNRIQLFRPGQLNGTTVAGNGSNDVRITLNHPTGVILDADGYLFIVDRDNHRIVGSGPNGFRCLVGCSGSYGSTSNQLHRPQLLAFDTYGNLFVTDWDNFRVQKFIHLNNTLGKY